MAVSNIYGMDIFMYILTMPSELQTYMIGVGRGIHNSDWIGFIRIQEPNHV